MTCQCPRTIAFRVARGTRVRDFLTMVSGNTVAMHLFLLASLLAVASGLGPVATSPDDAWDDVGIKIHTIGGVFLVIFLGKCRT